MPLTLHVNYGRGINSTDARGVVQRPDQPRIATTDFYQAGTSSNFGRFSLTHGSFLIDHSNEQVYIPDDGSFEFKGPSRAYGYEAKASVAITHASVAECRGNEDRQCVLSGAAITGSTWTVLRTLRPMRRLTVASWQRVERIAADAGDQPLPAGWRGSVDRSLRTHGFRPGHCRQCGDGMELN